MRGGSLLLQKLEAYGFKSFAEKTELEFKPGITAIVGPNGSGKSNISDAVRWVLGEQNVRNLRGAKMEDVIFAGSDKRRPLGVAEVTLVFDNSDGKLPLDFNEVTITRRVFRSGDSEYYINKSACRLKDIHDLLLEAGLGRDSMTVISQHKVDEVLNSKADERRVLFEEAAGIMKYKNRKKEALRKLDDTENNLSRVLDITTEIENQLEPLGESAARTARFNELAAELTSCQVTLLMDKMNRAEKNRESVTLEKAAIADDEVNVSTRLALAETEQERLTDNLASLDEIIKNIEASISGSATEIERLDGKAGVLGERIEQQQKSLDRLHMEEERLRKESEESTKQLEDRQRILRNKELQAEEAHSLQSKSEEQFQEVQASIAAVQQKVDAAKELTFEHMQELVTHKNTLRTLERDLGTLGQKRLQLDKERQDFTSQCKNSEALLQNVLKEQATLEQELALGYSQMQQMAASKQQQEKELIAVRAEEGRLNGQIGQASSRLSILTNMQAEYEGFGKGVKSVLKSNAPWRREVCGAVAQVLNVSGDYVVAVETALGGALQHIIVESDVAAKSAIELLKHQNLGRATFLPLNTIRVNRPRDSEIRAARTSGALGFASELVECDAKYRPVVEHLLARTIIAKDIDAALRIAKEQSFSVRIVTLEGDLINPGGSITGGSTGRREASFISRSNEIEVLKNDVAELDAKRNELRRHAENLRQEMLLTEEKIAQADAQKRQQELRQAELAVHRDKISADIKRLGFSLDTVEKEHTTCSADTQSFQNKISEAEKQIILLENRDSQHKLQLDEWQDELKRLLTSKESINVQLTDSKINFSALQQEVSAIKENCEQYRQIGGRVLKQIESAVSEAERIQAAIAHAGIELNEIVSVKDAALRNKEEQQKERDLQTAAKLEVLSEQQKLDRENKEMRRKYNTLQNRAHEIELLEAKVSYELNYCLEQLRDHHALSLEEAKALCRDENTEVLTAMIAQLEQDIEKLGPINAAAIEEYSRLKERYEFLRTQYQDLTDAKEYLTSVLKEIDATMTKQFQEAFHKINEHFGELFVRLFAGGKAQLVLNEEEDLLNSGIEIVVQPPGKKQQNLALLSGGERALTVLALLFAFLTYRPTPFCVLDEVDAALDEANVQRFSEFLKDYSRGTQFIIVTHRKGTMEAADVMHGVTMEESGISKLISVKFMDQAV
ncbi:MAG: smc 5 [Firmicutes bacterium]|nr:smc 5 [Bacillota bacterium]